MRVYMYTYIRAYVRNAPSWLIYMMYIDLYRVANADV